MGARRPHTELYCHLVWATWDREKIITPEWEPRLHGAIQAKLGELGCLNIAVGGVADHVHVICRFPAVHSIAYLVQQAKGSSSHLVSHVESAIQDFRWQGGYGAFSVSPSDVDDVRRYVLAQKQHHAVGELWDDWESTWPADETQPR